MHHGFRSCRFSRNSTWFFFFGTLLFFCSWHLYTLAHTSFFFLSFFITDEENVDKVYLCGCVEPVLVERVGVAPSASEVVGSANDPRASKPAPNDPTPYSAKRPGMCAWFHDVLYTPAFKLHACYNLATASDMYGKILILIACIPLRSVRDTPSSCNTEKEI